MVLFGARCGSSDLQWSTEVDCSRRGQRLLQLAAPKKWKMLNILEKKWSWHGAAVRLLNHPAGCCTNSISPLEKMLQNWRGHMSDLFFQIVAFAQSDIFNKSWKVANSQPLIVLLPAGSITCKSHPVKIFRTFQNSCEDNCSKRVVYILVQNYHPHAFYKAPTCGDGEAEKLSEI